MVLRISDNLPYVVTDCLGLVKTAAKGAAAACTSKTHLARIWNHIAHLLDGYIEQMAASKSLFWMPAHQTVVAIGTRTKSNGSLVASIE